jgi:ribosomal protein L11 methyltransferase
MIYRLKVQSSDAWELLFPVVDSILFSEDEEGCHYLWVDTSEKPEHPIILEAEERSLPSYDWEEQWRQHAPGYNGEFVPLNIAGQSLKLIPGPGFGDLSHPTTQLVLQMMPPVVKDKHVLDVGSGSGVLSVAAAACHAASVWAIDIDPQAEEHTRLNAEINQLSVEVGTTPHDRPLVVLINMILSEQKMALETLQPLRGHFKTVICSGVLHTELENAKKLWSDFTVVKVEQCGDWIGILFNRSAQI